MVNDFFIAVNFSACLVRLVICCHLETGDFIHFAGSFMQCGGVFKVIENTTNEF